MVHLSIFALAAAVLHIASAYPSVSPRQDLCTTPLDQSGSQNVGLGNAQQFITGQCVSPADCASGCCVAQAGGTGVCKARIPTEGERGESCDFVCGGSPPAVPADIINDEDNILLEDDLTEVVDEGGNANVGGGQGVQQGVCGALNAGSGEANVGTGNGLQFITGQCFSPADCASGCCVAQADGSAQCKARLVTEQRGDSCDFSCVVA